jgi:hypothetical protein
MAGAKYESIRPVPDLKSVVTVVYSGAGDYLGRR